MYELTQANTHNYELYVFPEKKTKSLRRMGPITSSLRRITFTCLDEIFASADPIPPPQTIPCQPGNPRHTNPTETMSAQSFRLSCMESSTQHGLRILVCADWYFYIKEPIDFTIVFESLVGGFSFDHNFSCCCFHESTRPPKPHLF